MLLYSLCFHGHAHPCASSLPCAISALPSLPRDRTISMTIYYYKDLTPKDYHPPFFKTLGSASEKASDGSMAVTTTLSSVYSNFHSIEVTTGRTDNIFLSSEANIKSDAPQETQHCKRFTRHASNLDDMSTVHNRREQEPTAEHEDQASQTQPEWIPHLETKPDETNKNTAAKLPKQGKTRDLYLKNVIHVFNSKLSAVSINDIASHNDCSKSIAAEGKLQ